MSNNLPLFRQFAFFLLFACQLNLVQAQAALVSDTTSFITTWKTDHPGTSNSSSITIPVHPTAPYIMMSTGIMMVFSMNWGLPVLLPMTLAQRGTTPSGSEVIFPTSISTMKETGKRS